MTLTDPRNDSLDAPAASRERLDRRAVLGIVVAALVLVAVALIVLVAGRIPLPRFDGLADAPDPSIPGTVAYLRPVERDWDVCVTVVPASGGEASDLTCRLQPERLGWTADGDLVVDGYGPLGPRRVVLDARTGEELGRGTFGPAPAGTGDRTVHSGRRLDIEDEGNGHTTLTVRGPDGEVRTLLNLRGPRDYALTGALWSPDGGWVLVTDNRGRILVVDPDLEGHARLLVEGAIEWASAPEEGGMTAWYVPGETTYTVDPGEVEP